MLDVHHKGRAVVSSGARERMEHDASQLARVRAVGDSRPVVKSGHRVIRAGRVCEGSGESE